MTPLSWTIVQPMLLLSATFNGLNVLAFSSVGRSSFVYDHSSIDKTSVLNPSSSRRIISPLVQLRSSPDGDDTKRFETSVNIPPKNSGFRADLRLRPILPSPSQLIEVRRAIPFSVSVEPKDGLAVCTKDGDPTNGESEKVGDVLRMTSRWTMGLPRGDGVVSSAMSFAGNIGWQCSLLDLTKAKSWNEVVEALTSNVPQRTDEVLMLFERPMKAEGDV